MNYGHTYEDVISRFEEDFEEEDVDRFKPVIKAAYNRIKKLFDENVNQKDATSFDVREAREKFKEKMRELKDVDIVNKATGIVAQVGKAGRSKPLSDVAIGKSIQNGYSVEQHFEAAMNIKQFFEDGWLAETRDDRNQEKNVLSIKYFHCETNVKGEKAVARIMAKEIAEHGHKICTIELQELNKPAELADRTDINPSAGSKDSAHMSQIADSLSTTESSDENITQSVDEGKAESKNETEEKYKLENELSARLFELTAEIDKLENSIRSNEENLVQFKNFGQKSVSRTTNNCTIKAVMSKDFQSIVVTQTDTNGKVALSYSIPIAEIEKATAKDDETQTSDELNKLVEKYFASTYKKKLREMLGGDVSNEDIAKSTTAESERYSSYHNLVVSNMRGKFRDYVPTENEKAELKTELEELKKRQSELNYTLQHLDEAYKAFKDGKLDEFLQGATETSATENQQDENKISVPIKLPDGRKIFDTYTKDKEFLSEGIGALEIPRYEIIEEKAISNARSSLNIEAERKYYDYVKQTLDATNVENNSPLSSAKTELHFEVGTHIHTKTGAKIPKAKLKKKVEREEYLKLNELAKKYGGSYSKVAKAFLFKSESGRDNFVKDASQLFGDIEQPATENRREEINNDDTPKSHKNNDNSPNAETPTQGTHNIFFDTFDAFTENEHLEKKSSEEKQSKDENIAEERPTLNEIDKRAQEILKEVGLVNRRPKKDNGLGRLSGELNSDSTLTLHFDKKFLNEEIMTALENITEKVDGTVNSENKTVGFNFKNIEDLAVFSRAVRIAFYGERSIPKRDNKTVVGDKIITLPEGYKTETGKELSNSENSDFIVDKDDNKNLGLIKFEIENKPNGIVKSAPIRL